MISARVRSEWARLRSRGLASVWAPACQDSSRVGHAGVGDPRGVHWFAQKCALRNLGDGSNSICVMPVYASLSGTAQSPWLLCMYGMLDKGCTSEKLQAIFI